MPSAYSPAVALCTTLSSLSRYERAQRGQRLVLIVKTTRFVAQGEELLVDYGDEYWRQLHKNRRRRALREANQYSDGESDESSEEVVARPKSMRHSSNGDESAILRLWNVVLEDLQPRGNRALDWLVKEELPEVLATGRRRFTVPAALADEAEVFARLHWQRFDKLSWKIPDEIEVQALSRAYDEHQRVQLRARVTRATGAAAAAAAAGRGKRQPQGDEGASMVTGYPELLGLLQLRELKENGTLSADEFAQFKGYLTRAFVGRFAN